MDRVKLVCSLLKEKRHFEARDIIISDFNTDQRLFNYYMGLYYYSESNFLKANHHFRLAKTHGLKSYIFYYNYALTYLELKNFNRAKELFKKSIDLNKEYKHSYLNLAYILVSEGNFKEAYRVVKSCLSYIDDTEVLNYERELLNKITS